MKAESLYIQKLTYDENTGNEIIGLFPSEANPAIVSSYTYDAKRMGGAPTLTATIYSSEPLQWKKEEFVEYNGDRFFASYTPNSTKDNSSRMWKSEITFTSRRELLDNTLFFDVVVDDVDTQNKDRYRSNQTKFTFGGTIYEFVARINSSMAYCGLYRPTDEYKGYYVVVDEGYGTDEVKEVSFEDQYLTDVLQLINTTFELDYYWDGSVCHVGKVQHDLTDTPIKYGSSDALISVSKENANYKIVDMITGYGSSDNLPYYYPNDDEFGEAVFNTENFSKSLVSSISLGDVWKWNSDVYNNTLIFSKNSKDYYTANVFGTSSYLITNFGGKDYKGKGEESKNVIPTCSMGEEYTEHNSTAVSRLIGSTTIWTLFEFTSSAKEDTVKMDGLSFVAKEADSALKFGLEFSYEYAYYVGENTNIDTAYKSIQSVRGGGSMSGKGGSSFGNSDSDVSNGWAFGDNIDGLSNYTKSSKKEHTFERNSTSTIVIACKITATNIKKASGTRRMNTVSTSISGSIELTRKPSSVYYFETSDGHTQPYDESGIKINGIVDIPHKDLTFSFDGTYWNATEGGENNAAKITITDRVWLAPSSVLMPSIYRNTKGAERFYYALNNTHKLPSGSGYYEFVNLYKKGNPHQGTVTFGNIKPTIKGIVNAEGQLFGEIADIAFDSADSDVKDSDGKYIHSYFYIKLHKFNGDFGFDLFAHALASEPAKINLIKSNGCPACSFAIYNQPSADNSKCYNCVSVDENGNLKPVRTDKNDYIFANASDAYEDKLNQDSTQKELWIAVHKDTSTLGIVMPNASAGFKPQKGDLFVITGIKPPKVLVTAAEKRLDDALVKHMSENNTDQFNYSVKFSRIFLQENHDFASKLNENAKLSIQIQGDSDSDGNLISHEVFVSNYSVKVDNDELAEVEIELVNSLEVTKSDTKQIIDAVKGEAVKSLSSMVGGSNTNSFNASITDKMYLSKLNDDTAKGTVTWEKVQKFLQGLAIGESGKHYIDKNGGASLSDVVVDRIHDAASTPSDRVIIGAQGFDLYMGDDGKSHMYLDNIVVRQKFFASSAEIRKISYSGGTTIFSNAGSTLAKVSVIFDADGNCIGYKCYACADDGTTRTMNWWRIGMMALCQTFNVKAGKNEKLQNRYYWRLVVGVGQEILDDGKLYDYVVLSNKEKFLGSESIVPTYANKLVTADGTNMLVFGDYGIEVSAAESMGSMAGILMKLEDKETDEGGNLIANRYFYGYESGIAQDAPAEGDVIVQVGDQICWKSRGNLIKISTSTEDNATDNAPAITMYHNLGALYSTGKKDSAGMEIISPYQWKTCTCVISPEQVKFNANNFMWFTEDPEKPFSPITVFYNIETNGMFRVGSSGRLYGDNVENGTAKVSVCCYKVMGDTKDVLDECWWESSCQDIKIDSPYTGRTDLQTNDAAAQNLPAYFTLDCYTLSVTADGTKHRGDVLLATMDIPVLKDGDKGEKGDKGDKGEQGLRGLQGETGEQGIPGTPGKDGKTTYFHIKYSSEANPTTAAQMTETPNTYIGTYVDFLPNDSTDPNVYTWSRFEGLQGKDGTNGIPGKNGADGRTSYLHIKYSNDGGQTLTVNDGETPGSWIGQYTDYEQKDSTNVTKYTWSKIKGEQGDKGDDAVSYTVTLTRGSNGITQGLYVGVTRYIGTACTTGTIIDFGMSCKAYTDGTLAEGLTDRLQTSDNYIDFAAFPKAKSFTVELFDKNGNKVATGNYSSGDDAISILVEDAPLVFDTDDSGTVPASVTKTAKVKVMKGNTNVADDCTQLTSRDDLSSNCMCNVEKDEDNGCISVSVQGNWISKNDVIVDGVNQGQVSATSGYAVAQFVYAGVVYSAQVPFSVNVAKFTGTVAFDNKGYKAQFDELSKGGGAATKNDITQATSKFEQTAREISLSVSEKSVGRRNMLVGSACRKYGDGFMYMSDAESQYYDGYPLEQIEKNSGIDGVNCIHCRTKQTGTDRYYLSGLRWHGISPQGNIKLEKGKNYVLSFYAKTHTPNDIYFHAEVLYQGSKIDTSRPAGYAGPTGYSTTFSASEADKWELFSVKVSVPPDALYEYVEINIFGRARSYSFVGGYICKPMLEEGENYNGWTLSEQDYDYVGGNLLDNARTLDKSGTLFESYDTVIQNGYGTDSACIKNLMKANANLSDYKEVLRWRFGSTYLVNGNDYIFSFVAKADVDDARVVCYMWSGDIENSCNIFTEGNGGAWDSKDDGNIVFILSRQWTRYWVHWRPKDGYVTPKEVIIRHTGNNSTSASTVYVTQPKLEIGATMTEWTERKSDLVDKASLKAAGIEITSDMVELYGNQVKVSGAKGGTPVAMFENGMLNSNLINANKIIARQLQTTGSNGQSVDIEDGLMRVYGTNGVCNIEFGVNSNGEAILSYYNKDGKWLYDLGPDKLDGGQLTESTLNGDSYISAISFFGTNDFYSIKMFIRSTVHQVNINYSQRVFGYNMFSDGDQEVEKNNAAHIGYKPFERLSNVIKLYRYTAPRQSGTIIKDERYGLTTPALAKQADGKYFTSNSTLAINGQLTNLAPVGYYFNKSVQVAAAMYSMANVPSEGSVQFPAYSIRWLNMASGGVGTVMAGPRAMMSYLTRTIKIKI
nr:MAG TPA: tail protein [Caudoviricetes sp.]